jgi:hypothetical protein
VTKPSLPFVLDSWASSFLSLGSSTAIEPLMAVIHTEQKHNQNHPDSSIWHLAPAALL